MTSLAHVGVIASSREPLSVAMTAPVNGATLPEDAPVTLTAAISRLGATCEFFVNSVSIGMGTVVGNTGSLSWTPADPGPYTIFARATEGGDTADSASIGVTAVLAWTPGNIVSVGKRFWLRADLGVTIASGVSVWADQYGLHNATQGGSGAQPARNLSDANFDGRAAISFDGLDDALIFGTLDLPSPGTSPIWFWLIFRMHTFASANALFGGTAGGAIVVRQDTTAPRITMNALATANPNNGAPPGATVRGIVSLTNSTADRLHLGASNVTGQNAGNIDTPAGSFSIAARSTGTSNFANMSIAEILCLVGEPSPAELAQLEAYGQARYPSATF